MKAIKEFTFTRTARESKYDWGTLLDGQIWELDRGDDYQCKDNVFQGTARNKAKKVGKKVRFAKHANGLVMQAYDNEPVSEPETATKKPPAARTSKGRRNR